MPYLTQLAAVAKRTGFPVTEVAGWRTRGHGPQPAVRGIVAHHTAGRDDMHVVRDGRPGLDGPLSQFWLRRDGRIYVVAAGLCWHNAPSTSANHTNSNSIGIEAENNGREAWPAVQLDSYKKLCAELCREFDLPASRVKGHKEVQVGKPDPHHVDMDDFRADVARLIEGEDDMTPEEVFNAVMNRDAVPAPPGGPSGPNWKASSFLTNTYRDMAKTGDVAKLNAKLDQLLAAAGKDVDETAIVTGILSGLTPTAIADAVNAALAPDLARQVVNELGERLDG